MLILTDYMNTFEKTHHDPGDDREAKTEKILDGIYT